jgi:Domain of unknown function (DUF3859)
MRHGFSNWKRLAATLLWLASGAGFAASEPLSWHDPKQIKDFSFGIFCKRSSDYVTNDENAIEEKVERYNTAPPLVAQTQIVPALHGLMFGVQGLSARPSDMVVTMVVEHPPLGDNGVTRESWDAMVLTDQMTMNGYVVGLNFGSPIGTWTVSAFRSGRKVYEVEFEVVDATDKDRDDYDPCT